MAVNPTDTDRRLSAIQQRLRRYEAEKTIPGGPVTEAVRAFVFNARSDIAFLLDLVQTLSRPPSPPSSPDTTLDLSCSAPVSEGGSGEGGRYPVGRWIKIVSQIPELNVRPCTYVAPPSSHPPLSSGEPRALGSSDGGRDSGALSADKIAAEVALIDLAHATDRIAKAIPYLVRLEKRLQIDLGLFDDADLAREALAHLWGQR